MISRKCSKCKVEKSLFEFYKNKHKPGGYTLACKSCEKHRDQIRHQAIRDNCNKTIATERDCPRCKIRKSIKDFYSCAWTASGVSSHCKQCLREAKEQKHYGISKLVKDEMFNAQSNKCLICYCTFDVENLCIDHNHKTGQVRGLLCKLCNSALGLLKENLETIENMKVYVEKWQKQLEKKEENKNI